MRSFRPSRMEQQRILKAGTFWMIRSRRRTRSIWRQSSGSALVVDPVISARRTIYLPRLATRTIMSSKFRQLRKQPGSDGQQIKRRMSSTVKNALVKCSAQRNQRVLESVFCIVRTLSRAEFENILPPSENLVPFSSDPCIHSVLVVFIIAVVWMVDPKVDT